MLLEARRYRRGDQAVHAVERVIEMRAAGAEVEFMLVSSSEARLAAA